MEDNTILEPELTPDEIRQNQADKIIKRLDDTATHPELINNQADDTQQLGLSTDEQRVLVYIRYKHPDDKYFINWSNIYKLGEQYYNNYIGEEYRAYQNHVKLLASKYYNPKKYQIKTSAGEISALGKDGKVLDKVTKPKFINAHDVIINGYGKIGQLRRKLDTTYKYLLGLPYVESEDKKKLHKLRNQFIKEVNAYYTHMYYFNRVNKNNMTEREISLPHLSMTYFSEAANDIIPRIDKVSIRLDEKVINQKYTNEAAKLELFLQIKQKLQEQESKSQPDKKLAAEIQELMKEYIEFDKLYQTKLLTHINNRKNKKIITDLVIFDGQPLPGDGAVINNEHLDIGKGSIMSALPHTKPIKNHINLDDMDEKERKRKFYFINKAKRERGDF